MPYSLETLQLTSAPRVVLQSKGMGPNHWGKRFVEHQIVHLQSQGLRSRAGKYCDWQGYVAQVGGDRHLFFCSSGSVAEVESVAWLVLCRS